MGTLVELARVNDLADGAMKRVFVQGREILVARSGASYYAAENRCPHQGANLSSGKLQGAIVTCPRHFSQFDLADGRMLRWTNWTGLKLTFAEMLRSPRPLRVYKVTLDGDRVMAEI